MPHKNRLCTIAISPPLTVEESRLLKVSAKREGMSVSALVMKLVFQEIAKRKIRKSREVDELEKLHGL